MRARYARLMVLAVLIVLPVSVVPTRAGSCGINVTSDFTLEGDLACSGTALFAQASGITIDLGGHRLLGDGTGVGVDVRYPATGVTIRGGQIEGFGRGVSSDSPRTTVDAMVISGSQGVGVFLMTAPDSRVTRSIITGGHNYGVAVTDGSARTVIQSNVLAGNTGYALFDLRSFDAQVQDNVMAGNGGGYAVTQADRVILERNVIAGNAGNGISIFESREHRVAGNVISGSPGAGVLIYDLESQRNELTDNLIAGNRVGVQLGEANFFPHVVAGTVINNNRINGNGAAGLLVLVHAGTVDGTVVTGNTFSQNGFHPGGVVGFDGAPINDGVNVQLGAGQGALTLTGNAATGNADYGFEAPGVVDGGGNTASGNGNPAQCLGVSC